jgi:hypothetical protein
VAAVGACDQPKWRGLEDAAASNSRQQSIDPLPARPGWLTSLQGRPLRAAFTREAPCIGYTEVVAMTYKGAPSGAKIIGWGWSSEGRRPPPRILLVDASSNIVGGGESGLERLDVPTAKPAISSKNTGWWALTTQQHGRLEAYGLLADGQTVCRLGGIDL